MLNANSPVVQNMLANVQPGIGSIPIYYGPTPQQFSESIELPGTNPYPTPRDMVMAASKSPPPVLQGGGNGWYNPYDTSPPNYQVQQEPIGYRKLNDPMFNSHNPGYSNPYMGIGSYGNNVQEINPMFGYGNPYANVQTYGMGDAWAAGIHRNAIHNGISFNEQVEVNTFIMKSFSRAISKANGADEEEATKRANCWDPKYQEEQRQNAMQSANTGWVEPNKRKQIKVRIRLSDDDVIEIDEKKARQRTDGSDYRFYELYRNRMMMIQRRQENIDRMFAHMHANSPERIVGADKATGLLDYLNNYANRVSMEAAKQNFMIWSRSKGVTSMFDEAEYKKKLYQNNGLFRKDKFAFIRPSENRSGLLPQPQTYPQFLPPSLQYTASGDPYLQLTNVIPPGHTEPVKGGYSFDLSTGKFNWDTPPSVAELGKESSAQLQKFLDAMPIERFSQ